MNAYLLLANGMVFAGQSVGAAGVTVGEVVFATGMVGFEETLTDPSYYGQIITQSYPLVGNYGINGEDAESGRIWAFGYIVRELCDAPSNFRCKKTLDQYLKEQNIIGLAGIDTRSLVRLLRESGVMNGALTTEYATAEEALADEALMKAIREYNVTEAVANVTRTETTVLNEGGKYHVALFDFGCKNNIQRSLVKRDCKVSVVPATTTASQLKEMGLDGIMLSNGPGDPAENVEIIKNIGEMLDSGIAAFGICLGHQLTALAAGAKTCKLKYGHRGANQPVSHYSGKRTFITSQNHGYAVEGETLPAEVGRVSYRNANDGTCEGVDYFRWNCFTVQFHPEANGGPKDTEFLFDEFVSRMLAAKGVNIDA